MWTYKQASSGQIPFPAVLSVHRMVWANHTGVAWLVFTPVELPCPHNFTQEGKAAWPAERCCCLGPSLNLAVAHCSRLHKVRRKTHASWSTELQAWKAYTCFEEVKSAVFLLKNIKRQNPCDVATAIPFPNHEAAADSLESKGILKHKRPNREQK